MAAYLADRVAQYSPSTGTGNLTLAANVQGHRTFAQAFGSGQVYYGIFDPATGDWETGVGSVASTTLTRTQVYASSNGGLKVAFGPGNKIVYNDIPADALFDIAVGDARYLRIDGAQNITGSLVFDPGVARGTKVQVPLSDNAGAFFISNDPDPDISGHHIRLVVGTAGGSDGKVAVQSGTGAYILLDPLNRTIGGDGALTFAASATFNFAVSVLGALSAASGSFTTINTSGNASIGGNVFSGGTVQGATGLLALNGQAVLRGGATDQNRELVFQDVDATERARIFSDGGDDSLHIRMRMGGTTRAEIVLDTAGAITTPTGYWKGQSFGYQVAGARNDLSSHIKLHGDGYGFSVTGASLNINMDTGAAAYFVYANASIIAQVDPPGPDANSTKTLITVEKGDPRYRNASNLNAGTIDVARLPTSAAEGYRIMALVAAASLGAIGSIEPMRRVTAGTNIVKGDTYSGANLRYAGWSVTPANAQTEGADNTQPPGSWMALSSIVGSGTGYTIGLFKRVL